MYKSMQVYTPIKTIMQDLKKNLELKNESEVIAYLYCTYQRQYKSITLEQHKQTLKDIKEILNQETL